MAVTTEQMAEYKRRFAALAKVQRALKIAVNDCNNYVLELMLEYEVEPGHAFDLWGDGEAKPEEQCAQPPKLT